MLQGASRLITHPRAGIVASLVALTFAGALAGALVRAHQQETFLKGRIAALAAHDVSQLQAELVSCRASVRTYAAQVAATRQLASGPEVRLPRSVGDRRHAAQELVARPPAGFDVCARMESADDAVMKTLDRR